MTQAALTHPLQEATLGNGEPASSSLSCQFWPRLLFRHPPHTGPGRHSPLHMTVPGELPAVEVTS